MSSFPYITPRGNCETFAGTQAQQSVSIHGKFRAKRDNAPPKKSLLELLGRLPRKFPKAFCDVRGERQLLVAKLSL